MKYKSLVFLFMLAALLRFWNLAGIPPSLSHDEVAIGYNAYSILTTGKDEYGASFPLLFRSFDDYKLPGYIYLTAISEKIFGLNALAVRFPSALLGVLTVFVFYFFLQELFTEASFSNNSKKINISNISLIGTFLFAISPWHINFSRAAFEANGSLFFILLGTFFLFKSRKSSFYFVFSSIAFVISIYFYYTARVVVPCILVVYAFLHRKTLVVSIKNVLIAIIIGIVFLFPLFPSMFSSGLSRLNQVSIFQDKSLTNPYSEAIVRNNNSALSKTVYNRRIAYFQEFSDNYLKNFAPDFYFTNGTGPMGLLYFWELPFFVYGLFLLFSLNTKLKWIIAIWFISVPVVGGLSTGQPNALRTLANVPMTVLLTTIGVYVGVEKFRNLRYPYVYGVFVASVMVFFFVRFLFLYFDYYPPLSAAAWGDGHKQMAEFVKENKEKYDNIYITGDNWRPYIYMLFYMGYPPNKYIGKGTSSGFSNIHFGVADWDKGDGVSLKTADLSRLSKKKSLFILSVQDYTSQNNMSKNKVVSYKIHVVQEINGIFVEPAFFATEIQ